MRILKLIAWALAIAFLMTACRGGGFLLTEWDRSHAISESKIEKLVILDPQFAYVTGEESSDFMEASEFEEIRYMDLLNKAAAQSDLELEIIYPDALNKDDTRWYSSLSQLRRHLITMNIIQKTRTQTSKRGGYGSAPADYEEALPLLDPEYAELSKTLGTPYVAATRCIVLNKSERNLKKGRTLIWMMVVNVSTGKTVYREIRELTGFPTENRMIGVLYDSFNILTNPKPPKNL